jgi:hypothetical protein
MTDTIPPTIIVTSDSRRLSAFQTTTITFTLSEPSSNFTVGDITVYGGKLSNFSGSGSVYTAVYSAQFTGFVSVPSSTFSDSAGNINKDGDEADNLITLIVNQAPSANAGPRQYVKTGTTISLNGKKSFDPDGDQLTYRWTILSQPIGSLPTLTNQLSAQPLFVADKAGSYSLALTVNDGLKDSVPSFTNVVVSNVLGNYPPNADAGPTQYAKPGEAVTLNGTNSSDPNGDQLSYSWSVITYSPEGRAPVITTRSSEKPVFVANYVGSYIVTLVVNDGLSNSEPSITVVEVSLPNTAPIANAGINQNVVIGKVTLDGSASFDADGNKLIYKWYLVSKPNNSTATLASPSSSKPTFTTDIAGEYVFTLVVNDGKVDSAPVPTVVIATLSSIPDTTPPSIRLVEDNTNLRAGLSKTITFYLSEPSSNFVLSDVNVTGGTLSNWVGKNDTYTALFTPFSNSTTKGVVSVGSGVFTDSAQNANSDGSDANNSVSFAVDTVFPAVILSTNKSNLSSGEKAILTFTLSESSTNFTEFDVTVSGGTLANFSGSGTTYTAVFTPIVDNSPIGFIGVPSDVFRDTAGNANTDGYEKNNSVFISKASTNLTPTLPISFPVKTWTNLIGSVNNDEASALTYGLDGSIYVGVIVGDINTGSQPNNYALLTKYRQDGNKVWEQKLKHSSITEQGVVIQSLTTGLDGAIFVGGYSVDLNNSFYKYGFITKYSQEGTKLWSRDLNAGFDSASTLATGLDDSVYVSGLSREMPTSPNSPSSGPPYLFLNKYNRDGTVGWTLMSDTSHEVPYDLAIGLDGSVYITGVAPGRDTGDGFYNQDMFLKKYSPDGKKVFTKLLGSNKFDYATAITTGLDGSIYVSGYTFGSFEGQTQIGGYDAFLTKYKPDGTIVWSKVFGSSNNDYVNGITTGLDGSIYVSGSTISTLDVQESSQPRTFLTKFNIDGMIDWTELLGASYFYFPNGYSEGNNSPKAITTDLNGSIYIGGKTSGSFEGQNSIGGYDAFLTKFEIRKVLNYQKNISVIVDKGVIDASAILLKNLSESITYTDGVVTSHTFEYSGSTFDYNQIDSLITTVTRDGEFTAEFTKEINDYLGAQKNISYSAAVAIVGAASIDGVILSVAGADGNFVG